MLTEMLNESGTLNNLPLPQKTILLTLASQFQSRTDFLFMSPEELEKASPIGNKDQWQDLLKIEQTKNYIKGQMAALSEIAQRKTFQSLVQSALQGNHQAAKQVQELSGILNQQDTNRTIILHQIPRPDRQPINNQHISEQTSI
jgi:DNA repair protein RadC